MFCPYCGHKIVRGFFSELFEDLDKLFKGDEKIRTVKFPPGRITVRISGPHRIRPLKKIPVKATPIQKTVQRTEFPEKIVEPESNITRKTGKLYYEIKLPTVKSIQDIFLNILEESIEIKAIGKGVTYFKVIPIPENSEVVNKEFKNGKLILTLM